MSEKMLASGSCGGLKGGWGGTGGLLAYLVQLRLHLTLREASRFQCQGGHVVGLKYGYGTHNIF